MGQKAKNAGKKKSVPSSGKLATSYKNLSGDFRGELMETFISVWGDKRSKNRRNIVNKKDIKSMLG